MLFIYVFNQYIKKYGHKYKNNDLIETICESKMRHLNIYRYYIYNMEKDVKDISENEILKASIDVYVEVKKHCNSFYKLYRKYKYKKAIRYDNDHDLCFEPLSKYSDKYLIDIVQNNTIYKFRLSDLIGIWCTCLNNSEGLFPKPIDMKNPNTNVIFRKHNLYNIYFKCMETGFHIPVIITNFFYSDFNIDLFHDDYYPQLKQGCINNYVKNASLFEIYEAITNMLYEYRKEIDYKTLDLRPSRTIIKKCITLFSRHLKLYMTYKYSCNPTIKVSSDNTCKRLLKILFQNKRYEFYDITMIEDRTSRIRDSTSRSRRRRSSILSNPPPPPPPPAPERPLEMPTIPELPPLPSIIHNNYVSDSSNSILSALLNTNNQNNVNNQNNTNNISTTLSSETITSINNLIRQRRNSRHRRRRSIYAIDARERHELSELNNIIVNEFDSESDINPFLPSRELNRSPPRLTPRPPPTPPITSRNIENRLSLNRTPNQPLNSDETQTETTRQIANSFNFFRRN